MRVWKGRAPFTPEEKARMLDLHRSEAHYMGLLGLRLADIEPGYCKLELPFKREISHGRGIVQGGILTTLADSCIAHATVAALLGEERHSTTIELKINFIRPATPSLFTAEAWLIHLGSRTAIGEAEIVNGEGKLIAKCLSSLMILPGGREPVAVP
jgi:acyl-CoA thioesterase